MLGQASRLLYRSFTAETAANKTVGSCPPLNIHQAHACVHLRVSVVLRNLGITGSKDI